MRLVGLSARVDYFTIALLEMSECFCSTLSVSFGAEVLTGCMVCCGFTGILLSERIAFEAASSRYASV